MEKKWTKNKDSFPVTDVRELTGNFLPMLLKKAKQVTVGEGICVVQSFEPVPLYSAMGDLGFEHFTEKVAEDEYRVYFYKSKDTESSKSSELEVPLRPTALVNLKTIDNDLAKIGVDFWQVIWNQESPALDQKTKLLLSLSNGVGARRFRQATRELVKAYAAGVTIAEFDEVFAMFVWNQGIGTFASEIGPSALFSAYRLIKNLEKKGKSRREVMDVLVEKFSEKNPEVGTIHKL
jgi:alkylhydroperoxidase/carboxymuconolactone decarboxylase family protein YurZ